MPGELNNGLNKITENQAEAMVKESREIIRKSERYDALKRAFYCLNEKDLERRKQ